MKPGTPSPKPSGHLSDPKTPSLSSSPVPPGRRGFSLFKAPGATGVHRESSAVAGAGAHRSQGEPRLLWTPMKSPLESQRLGFRSQQRGTGDSTISAYNTYLCLLRGAAAAGPNRRTRAASPDAQGMLNARAVRPHRAESHQRTPTEEPDPGASG